MSTSETRPQPHKYAAFFWFIHIEADGPDTSVYESAIGRPEFARLICDERAFLHEEKPLLAFVFSIDDRNIPLSPKPGPWLDAGASVTPVLGDDALLMQEYLNRHPGDWVTFAPIGNGREVVSLPVVVENPRGFWP